MAVDMGYTKLHATILDSSIWLEPAHVRLVWITMLAMADQHGVVLASVGGLAHRARVTKDECAEALARFLGPDPDSRDGTTGERIEKVDGGWLLLNHANYRERQTREQALTAARVARHRIRAKERASVDSSGSVTGRYVTEGNTASRSYAYASESVGSSGEGEPERETPTPRLTKADRTEHDPAFLAFWNAYDRKVAKVHAVKAWVRIAPDEALAAEITKAAAAYAKATPDVNFRKHPASWLNARCWEDQPPPAAASAGRPGGFDRNGKWRGVGDSKPEDFSQPFDWGDGNIQ